jgi:hypothetical protein
MAGETEEVGKQGGKGDKKEAVGKQRGRAGDTAEVGKHGSRGHRRDEEEPGRVRQEVNGG